MPFLDIYRGYAYIRERYYDNGVRKVRTIERLGKVGKDITLEQAIKRKELSYLPKKKYDIIVIDPPWRYDNKRETDPSHRGDVPYEDMNIEQIKRIPIRNYSQKNCILWLWTTNAFMLDALQIIKFWEFEQKTILTWKKNKMGLGTWLRGKTEHCIMAVKGKPTVNLTNQTTIIDGNVREHSRKPEEFYKLVEALCVGSKLDYFGREPREGWDVFGCQGDMFCEKN